MIARRTLIALAILAFALPAAAQAINGKDGLALKGYDAVAYFGEGKLVAGSPSFIHRWQGVEWRFASAANRDAFAAEPEKYAPQYGGFCAWAVANGYTAEIDSAAFRIVENRLYLNYSKSVQRDWEKDVPGNISKANGNWPKLSAPK
jgi:YHS domain-containing protein